MGAKRKPRIKQGPVTKQDVVGRLRRMREAITRATVNLRTGKAQLMRAKAFLAQKKAHAARPPPPP